MFETSVVRAPHPAAARRLSLLSASVFVHTAIIIGTVSVSIASTGFPAEAPSEYKLAPTFAAIEPPPPLGNPNGGARPQPAQTPPAQKPPVPNQVTAPPDVPNEIPAVSDEPASGEIVEGAGEGDGRGTVPGPVGQPWGDPSSVGPLDAMPAVDLPVQPRVEERIYQPHEVTAPVVLSKVEPRYPQRLMRAGATATVVVRCVIDKSGSVRDAQIVVPAPMEPFNAEVLNVLPQWRYKPATYGGRPVDSYLTVTVHFRVKR